MPGPNRPWSTDPDDVSQPLWLPDEGLDDVGPAVRVGTEGDNRVTSCSRSTVASSVAAGRPQPEQNRLPVVSGVWQ